MRKLDFTHFSSHSEYFFRDGRRQGDRTVSRNRPVKSGKQANCFCSDFKRYPLQYPYIDRQGMSTPLMASDRVKHSGLSWPFARSTLRFQLRPNLKFLAPEEFFPEIGLSTSMNIQCCERRLCGLIPGVNGEFAEP